MSKPITRQMLAIITLNEQDKNALIEQIKADFPTPDAMAAEVLRLSKAAALGAKLDTWVYSGDRHRLSEELIDGLMGSIRLDRVRHVVSACREALAMESLEDERKRTEKEQAAAIQPYLSSLKFPE